MIGSGRVAIGGVIGGALEVLNPRRVLRASSDSAIDGVRIVECPLVSVDSVQVSLNPPMFRLAGIGFALGWTELPIEFQSRNTELVAEAISLVRRFQPSTFSHFAHALRVIALKPHDKNFFNLSTSELPGAFVCSVPSDSCALAAAFIHEFHHSRLFFIEEAGPFLEAGDEDVIEGENHYSPWVASLRPLHGILHAIYVFLPTFRFWSAVLRDGSAGKAQLDYARGQVALTPVQLRIGINQLRRHARFTRLGSEVFEELERDVAAAEREARSLGAGLDAPAMAFSLDGTLVRVFRGGEVQPTSVGEILLEHLETSDVNRECAEEKEILVRALN